MFLCVPKTNYIIHFFLDILHFKGSCYREPQICHIWVGGEIKITTLVFILDYFQEELMIKFFKKIPKTLFQSHFGSFFPYFGKNEFSWKNRLSVFKYSN